MYLIRKTKARTKHIWTGYDTACRMHSTGGMNKKKYIVVNETDLPLCTMCENKQKSAITGTHGMPRIISKEDEKLLEDAKNDFLQYQISKKYRR